MSPPTTIRVAPNTRFSLEIGKAGTQQQTNLGLMIGCVTVKCAKLSGSQSVRVQTDSALMGVRGTSFTVTAAASGDLLVDCEEGEVECTDEQGVIERAVTGEVVEKLLDARMQRRPVAGQGLAAYRQTWNADRMAALKANAGRAIAAFAVKYVRLRERFDGQFAALQRIWRTVQRWRAEDQVGKPGTVDELASRLKELRELGPILKGLRQTLNALQPVRLRLLALKELHDQGIGRGVIQYDTSSESTTKFFQGLAAASHRLDQQIARVRVAARLYARFHDDVLPGGGFAGRDDPGAFVE